NLRQRPECTLLALDPANRLRTMEVRARATIVPDPDRSVHRRLLEAFRASLDTDTRDPYAAADAEHLDPPGVGRHVAVLDIFKVNVFDRRGGPGPARPYTSYQ